MFNKDDIVLIKDKKSIFNNYEAVVLESDDFESKVKLEFKTNDGDKTIINLFPNDVLELISNKNLTEQVKFDKIKGLSSLKINTINSEVKKEMVKHTSNKQQAKKLTEQEFKLWCADNDVSYFTQEINENYDLNVRKNGKIFGRYNFKTHILKLVEEKENKINEDVDNDNKKSDYDWLQDYVMSNDNLDDKNIVPGWQLASRIATAENICVTEVIDYALEHEKNYNVFLVKAEPTFSKYIIASKDFKEEDLLNDFCSYLQGTVTIEKITK